MESGGGWKESKEQGVDWGTIALPSLLGDRGVPFSPAAFTERGYCRLRGVQRAVCPLLVAPHPAPHACR